MPQQIDLRILESAVITIPQNFAARLQMNCDAESSTLCRNVDVRPDKERSEKIRLGSFRQWRYIDNRSTYISTEIVVARYRGVSRATGKANLARAGLTARCARQHGVATAKSRRRAGCRVRSSGRRQSCGECDRANSHPAENGNRREGPAEWG